MRMAHAMLPGAALGFLARRPVAAGDEPRRLRRRPRGGAARRRRRPAHARLREDASFAAFYLMSLALGRADRLAARQQCRPAARPVRHRPGGRRRRAHPGRPRIASVTAAGPRRRSTGRWSSNASTRASCARSGAARARLHICCSWCWSCSTWWRLPGAGHADGGRPDDAARRRRRASGRRGLVMALIAAPASGLRRELSACWPRLLPFNVPSGPAIILTSGAGYLALHAVGPKGGLLWRARPAPASRSLNRKRSDTP